MEVYKYLISVFSGGVILEVIKLFYPDLRKFFSQKIEAKKLLNKHTDSILKAADELFGKIQSLARDDFQMFTKYDQEKDEMNKIYVLYLFANFWARLGILKQESNFISLGRVKKGKQLLCFTTAYEAKRNRILERSYQRAIGESLIFESSNGLKTLNLFEFINEYKNENSNIRAIIQPLERSLFNTSDKIHRQKILIFGIIIQALIDFLDRDHVVARNRDPYTNKLSKVSKEKIKGRVFNHYLPFVKTAGKYYRNEKPRKRLFRISPKQTIFLGFSVF